MEVIRIYVARGERRIKFILNIFKLNPKIETLEQLSGVDGLQFKLPPNSMTEMELRSDDIKGPPLFSLSYMNGHKLKRFYTKSGVVKSCKRLTITLETDINNFEVFVKRWNEFAN